MRRMYARWPGRCKGCGFPIHAGEWIEHTGVRGEYGHPGCLQLLDLEPEERARVILQLIEDGRPQPGEDRGAPDYVPF